MMKIGNRLNFGQLVITDQKEILEKTLEFYKGLFSRRIIRQQDDCLVYLEKIYSNDDFCNSSIGKESLTNEEKKDAKPAILDLQSFIQEEKKDSKPRMMDLQSLIDEEKKDGRPFTLHFQSTSDRPHKRNEFDQRARDLAEELEIKSASIQPDIKS